MFYIGVLGAALITFFYKYTYLDEKWPRLRALFGFLSGFLFEMITGQLILPLPILAELLLASLVGLAGVGLSFLIENITKTEK